MKTYSQTAKRELTANLSKINDSPIDSLRSLIAESSIDLPEGYRLWRQAFGYMGYDAVRLSEKIPDNNNDDLGVPDGLFLRPSLICISIDSKTL